jgi:hypothetical protein
MSFFCNGISKDLSVLKIKHLELHCILETFSLVSGSYVFLSFTSITRIKQKTANTFPTLIYQHKLVYVTRKFLQKYQGHQIRDAYIIETVISPSAESN